MWNATAAAATSSPPGEVVEVELELSTMNSQEIQAVKIISENSWHLWQAGVLSLRTVDGQKVENSTARLSASSVSFGE